MYILSTTCCILAHQIENDNIVDEITMLTQPPNKNPSRYQEELVVKRLRCGGLYGKYILFLTEVRSLYETLIKRLGKEIGQRTKVYWVSLSQLIMAGEQQGTPNSQVSVKWQNRLQTMWKSHAQLVNLNMCSEMGSISNGQESGADPYLMAI